MVDKDYDFVNNKSLEGIPDVFLKYCQAKTPEEINDSTKQEADNTRNMIFMMLIFFIFSDDNNV